MRLIDADILDEEIKNLRVIVTGLRAGKGILNEYAKQYRQSLLRIIEEQPTAYDINKVVEELKNNALTKFDNNDEIDLDEAIEIVKQGSVGTDDVCEWKVIGNSHMFSKWETGCGQTRFVQKLDSYKFCPYCSKKIKEVE